MVRLVHIKLYYMETLDDITLLESFNRSFFRDKWRFDLPLLYSLGNVRLGVRIARLQMVLKWASVHE